MLVSRSFKISLLISILIHVGGVVALSHETIASKILTAPRPLLARTSEPKSVRFELIETPASAETSEAPEESRLFSDKNTRAQDMFQGDKKLQDSPHMEGKHEDSKDTRPRTIIDSPPPPPVEQPAAEKEESSQKPRDESPTTPAEPKEKIAVVAEPKKEEVIRLARKEPEAALPPTSPSSTIMSAASSRNLDADAQITGELSFAASRHFFGEYLLNMKQAIERQWISRLVSGYSGVNASYAVIDFKIQPDGHISDVVIDSFEGDSYFPVLCVSSIHDAQPFDKIPYEQAVGLPESLQNKPLNIRFTFRYN